jgi:hypothetical protein
MAGPIRAVCIAAVWGVRKLTETHWVLEALQLQQIQVVEVVAIGVDTQQVKLVSQMEEMSVDTRQEVAARVGQRQTLCLQRTPKASVQVTDYSPLPLRKTQRFLLQQTLLQMAGTLAFMFRGLLQRIKKLRVIASSGARRLEHSPM